jgi:hypothetical protein
MSDTDIPGMGGLPPAPDYSTPPRRVRPIASPFGIFAFPSTPAPTQAPGFNVQPDTPPPTNPMASLLASFMPSGENWKQSLAENLGALVDATAWALMKLGVPIPRAPTETPYMAIAPNGSRGTWAPAVSLSAPKISGGMLDNPPSLDAALRAMRRPGLF